MIYSYLFKASVFVYFHCLSWFAVTVSLPVVLIGILSLALFRLFWLLPLLFCLDCSHPPVGSVTLRAHCCVYSKTYLKCEHLSLFSEYQHEDIPKIHQNVHYAQQSWNSGVAD